MICISVCLFIQNKQLYYAAKDGNLKDVQRLIGEGADVSWSYLVSIIIIIVYHTITVLYLV